MDKFRKLNLKGNPFRVTPSVNSNEIVWAGFKNIKSRIERRITRAINIPNTSLILNWGEYGSGKTHALRYFCSQKVLEQLSNECSIPYAIDLRFPKSKEPVKEIFTQIVDKLDIHAIREDIERQKLDIQRILSDITDNIFMQKVFSVMFDKRDGLFEGDPEGLEFKSFLYGTMDNKKFLSRGVSRKFTNDNDYIDFLAILFSILTYEKKAYSCVILWIDEFEDISILNTTNISNVNNFVRTLIDKCPNNLLMFLNLTLSAMINVSDLGEYLQEAVKSRIIDSIEFSIPSSTELKEYLRELLNASMYRLDESLVDNEYTPFSPSVIDAVIQKLGDASLRKYNEVFSILIETAAFDNVAQIDDEYFNHIKSEIMSLA